MELIDSFFKALNIDKTELSRFSKKSGISVKKLCYFNDQNILPSGLELENIQAVTSLSKTELMLKMRVIDHSISELISQHATEINKLFSIPSAKSNNQEPLALNPVFTTELGKLYETDCLNLLSQIPSNSIGMVFADPPFNLNKLYPSEIDDNLRTESYIKWCEKWIDECIRVLKFNGSFFMWNLPKRSSLLSNSINRKLSFRHWVAVDLKCSLPISGRLYPAHYSLLYYVKGDKPHAFHPDRLAMQVCPKCTGDLKDYGGYKAKMNPKGVNLSDIWLDIPPVRHQKYKRRKGANELSLKLLDRIIELSTNEGGIIFDPFGGSGTTYMTAEVKNRKWIGCEIGPTKDIIDRFGHIDEEKQFIDNYRKNINNLFPEHIQKKREKLGLWTCESVKIKELHKKTKQSISQENRQQAMG